MASRAEKRKQYKESVYRDLERIIQSHIRRNNDPILKEHIRIVSEWQSMRIGQTYADVAATERYDLALAYFKDDMYGAKDYSKRDSDVKKVYPIVERIMPNRLFYILVFIMELNALSMELDEAQAIELLSMGVIDNITYDNYAEAYRNSASRADRTRQIDLVLEVGSELDKLMGKNYLGGFLKISHKPAHALGLGELHEFLERGYTAFMKMKGAKEFIKVIRTREDIILENIYTHKANPFEVEKVAIK